MIRKSIAICLLIFAITASVIALFLAWIILNTPGKILNNSMESVSKIVENWGKTDVNIKITHDTLDVKPVKELILSKITTRIIEDYKNTQRFTDKRIIAHQKFEIRIGWDLSDNITFDVSNVRKIIKIKALNPKIIATSSIEKAPTILLESDGVANRLNINDMNQVVESLQKNAETSSELDAGLKLAKENFETYFRDLFKMLGYEVEFQYVNPTF